MLSEKSRKFQKKNSKLHSTLFSVKRNVSFMQTNATKCKRPQPVGQMFFVCCFIGEKTKNWFLNIHHFLHASEFLIRSCIHSFLGRQHFDTLSLILKIKDKNLNQILLAIKILFFAFSLPYCVSCIIRISFILKKTLIIFLYLDHLVFFIYVPIMIQVHRKLTPRELEKLKSTQELLFKITSNLQGSLNIQ